MKKLALLLLFLPLFMLNKEAQAQCKQVVKAEYQMETGWSDPQKVKMTFMSGQSLNQRRGRFEHDSRAVYAVIFWNEDKATVIDLDTYLECGTKVSCNCITGDLTGKDQGGRKWRICVKDHCQ